MFCFVVKHNTEMVLRVFCFAVKHGPAHQKALSLIRDVLIHILARKEANMITLLLVI